MVHKIDTSDCNLIRCPNIDAGWGLWTWSAEDGPHDLTLPPYCPCCGDRVEEWLVLDYDGEGVATASEPCRRRPRSNVEVADE